MDFYQVLRPLLFSLPPDMAHDVSQWAFRRRLWARLSFEGKAELPLDTTLAGTDLSNPFGLAAGFDKNGDITAAVTSLGFGFTVVGSVRAAPHPGNPRPWFVRRTRADGLVNSMGLPSRGAAHVKGQLEPLSLKVPLMVSVTGETTDDFLRVCHELKGVTTHWEMNLSCPNTSTGRTFEEDLESFRELLNGLRSHPQHLFLKLTPYETERGRERTLEMASLAVRRGFKNFTLCNTLAVEDDRLGIGRGGLSGRPLFPLALKALRDFNQELGDEISVIGVGGIITGSQAFEMLNAGAKAVELLTALILRGPFVVEKLIRELESTMKAKDFSSVRELIGHSI
ncbi:MAG: dihydroorotate dehydrogenase 2 [Candidatus Thermoplasmatota archaeon]|nr:dihydroorotate dehydrogenase 2 [Candidatus Thermoplasmatota archaeon]